VERLRGVRRPRPYPCPDRRDARRAALPLDGSRVTRYRGGWGEPGKTFAIGLGCEIRHAHRLVYSDGLDLSSPSAATPIGMGCRVCERLDCPQRAAPPLGQSLRIDENTSTFVPYPVTDRTN
jgi:predicted transcriptional regulator